MFRQWNRVTITREGWRLAFLGQPILFVFQHTTALEEMMHVRRPQVWIDGQPVETPEFAYADTNPGCIRFAYVFRPERPGTYRIELTPHMLSPKAKNVHTITVLGLP